MITYDLTLGALLGAGGEGAVFELARHPGLCAKVYREAPDQAKREHIEHLIAHASKALAQCTAWPLALQVNAAGETVLILPRLSGAREVHDFYGPESRQRHFQEATWADCVEVAQRIAAIVALVHDAGFVIGDLNEQNFLIDAMGQPVLIDCDSIMSTHAGRSTCGGVYRDEWLAPELIGADLAAIARTANHDNFALAVMLFRLLMMGRNPFAGSPIGAMPTLAEAVASHEFVYADMSNRMAPPASAPPFAMLPFQIREMFIKAFGTKGRTKRPSAKAWSRALRALKSNISVCKDVPTHAYANAARRPCPWCELAPRYDAFPARRVAIAASKPALGLGKGRVEREPAARALRAAPNGGAAPALGVGDVVQVCCAALALAAAAMTGWLIAA